MNNSQPQFDVWRVASCHLMDHRETVSVEIFNKLLGYVRSRNIHAICSSEFTEANINAQSYLVVAQLKAFFSKNASFSDDRKCKIKAFERFVEAEMLCRVANKRLKHYGNHAERNPYAAEMAHMRDNIKRILGRIENCLEEIPGNLRYTSGSTENAVRALSRPYRKAGRKIRCTSGSLPLLMAITRKLGITASSEDFYSQMKDGRLKVSLCDFNRVVFVPKNYKTHRSIAAEPAQTLPFQLCIDSYLKDRLKYEGIDLRSQKRNQELARSASVDGTYATIDLSMASDTLSYELVRSLIPKRWFSLLNSLRSICYKVNDPTQEDRVIVKGRYEKFSSMGNGFTFPLETLIFYAACKAIGSEAPAVYGDDIVIETKLASKLISLLRFMGFYTNKEKTFVDGPFRESCGEDYLNGVRVRPVFLRKTSKLTRMELSHVVNVISSVSKPGGLVWSYLRDLVRDCNLHAVPYTENTQSGIHCTYDFCLRNGGLRHSNWITEYRGYREVPVSRNTATILSDMPVDGSNIARAPKKRCFKERNVKGYLLSISLRSLQMKSEGRIYGDVDWRNGYVPVHASLLREYAMGFKEPVAYVQDETLDTKIVSSWLYFRKEVEPPHLELWTQYCASSFRKKAKRADQKFRKEQKVTP